MKYTIDTTNKTITLHEDVVIGEFLEDLKTIPGYMDYKIIRDCITIYPTYPIYPYYPAYPYTYPLVTYKIG